MANKGEIDFGAAARKTCGSSCRDQNGIEEEEGDGEEEERVEGDTMLDESQVTVSDENGDRYVFEIMYNKLCRLVTHWRSENCLHRCQKILFHSFADAGVDVVVVVDAPRRAADQTRIA